MSMNIFERAARAKLRFSSPSGLLTTEQLFELPLLASANRTSLDVIARGVFAELKSYDEASFVETKPEPRKVELQLQLELVKHVITAKQADAAAAEARVRKAEERRKLSELLAKKQDASLEGLTEAQILEKLAALDA